MSQPPPSPKVVLVIEDEDALRSLVQLFLAKKKYKFVDARNGLEGVGLAKAVHPDLIITDLMMPGMSGVELIKELKQDPKTKDIPIICVTGAGYEEQRAASDAGAQAVVSKPLHLKEFNLLVAFFLS